VPLKRGGQGGRLEVGASEVGVAAVLVGVFVGAYVLGCWLGGIVGGSVPFPGCWSARVEPLVGTVVGLSPAVAPSTGLDVGRITVGDNVTSVALLTVGVCVGNTCFGVGDVDVGLGKGAAVLGVKFDTVGADVDSPLSDAGDFVGACLGINSSPSHRPMDVQA